MSEYGISTYNAACTDRENTVRAHHLRSGPNRYSVADDDTLKDSRTSVVTVKGSVTYRHVLTNHCPVTNRREGMNDCPDAVMKELDAISNLHLGRQVEREQEDEHGLRKPSSERPPPTTPLDNL